MKITDRVAFFTPDITHTGAFDLSSIPGLSAELATAIDWKGNGSELLEKSKNNAFDTLRFELETKLMECKSIQLSEIFQTSRTIQYSPSEIIAIPGPPALVLNVGSFDKDFYQLRKLSAQFALASGPVSGSLSLSVKTGDFVDQQEIQSFEATRGGFQKIDLSDLELQPTPADTELVFMLEVPANTRLYRLQRRPQPGELSASDYFADSEFTNAVASDKTLLAVSAELSLSVDKIINHFSTELLSAFAYLTASGILKMKLNSYRVNLFTNTNRAETTLRSEEYQDTARKRIKAVVSSVAAQISRTKHVPEQQQPVFQTGSYVSDGD